MLKAVRAIYDGENFIPNEKLNLKTGSRAVITILDDSEPIRKRSVEERIAILNKYCGSGGKMFDSGEEEENFLRSLRQ